MNSKLTIGLLLIAVAAPGAMGQVVLNEVYAATPDFIELRNIGTTTIDVSGWTVQSFQSGGGALNPEPAYTIPNGNVLAPDEFLVLQEFGSAGSPGSLGACAIRVGFNYNWTSSRTIVVVMTDSTGAGVDYVYRDNGGPAGTPQLPAGVVWTGSLTTTGNVIIRNVDVDTDDASDWTALSNGNETPCFFNPGQTVPPPPPPPFNLDVTTTGVGDVDFLLDSDPALPNAEYYTLVSTMPQMPTGSGPVFGLGIDVIDQFTTPLIIGSPFHGRLDGAGDFQAIFPPGSIAPGLTVDARSIAIKPDSSLELSDIVNITF